MLKGVKIIKSVQESFPIVLASSSPRRIDMMREHGISPIVIPADIDEVIPRGLEVHEAVMHLALEKAMKVADDPRVPINAWVVGADTVVYKDRIIGKPASANDAFNTLKLLCGDSHEVYTGVAIIQMSNSRHRVFYERTRVFFKDYSDKEIWDYISTGEPFDKAGGYAIQGKFSEYIDYIEGDRNNVIGFPWDRFIREWEYLGVDGRD